MYFGLQDINPTVNTMCLYVEFLARSFSSAKSIINYIGGVRLLHHLLGIKPLSLEAFDLKLMLRAVSLTIGSGPCIRLPITLDILFAICQLCDNLMETGVVLKCVFLFAFFGFLRCSNVVPNSARFDPKRQLCGGDIFRTESGLTIMLKWSKTRQSRDHVQLVSLPSLNKHPLCPVKAYNAMIRLITPENDLHLFRMNSHTGATVLTARSLRGYLRALLIELGLSP